MSTNRDFDLPLVPDALKPKPKTDEEVKEHVLKAASGTEMLAVMGMNRHARRAIAKLNKRAKIPGSMKPYVKAQKSGKAKAESA